MQGRQTPLEKLSLLYALPSRAGIENASACGIPTVEDGADLRVDGDNTIGARLCFDAAGDGLHFRVIAEFGELAQLCDPEAGIAEHKTGIPAGGGLPALLQDGKFQIGKGADLSRLHFGEPGQGRIIGIDDVEFHGVGAQLGQERLHFGDVGFGERRDLHRLSVVIGLLAGVGVIIQQGADGTHADIPHGGAGDRRIRAGKHLCPAGAPVGLGGFVQIVKGGGRFPFVVNLLHGVIEFRGGVLEVFGDGGAGVLHGQEGSDLIPVHYHIAAVVHIVAGGAVGDVFGGIFIPALDNSAASVFSFCHNFPCLSGAALVQ